MIQLQDDVAMSVLTGIASTAKIFMNADMPNTARQAAINWWRLAMEIPFPLFSEAMDVARRVKVADLLWEVSRDEDLLHRNRIDV